MFSPLVPVRPLKRKPRLRGSEGQRVDSKILKLIPDTRYTTTNPSRQTSREIRANGPVFRRVLAGAHYS